MNNILRHFGLDPERYKTAPLGSGLINDTYMVRALAPDAESYVLQRINHNIFTNVDLLQRNIEAVTDHIRGKLKERGAEDPERRCLRFVKTDEGKIYYFDGNSYWRLSRYLDSTFTRSDVNPETAYITGKAFGEFQEMLADLPACLGETIPDFHNMEFRLKQFEEAIADDKAGRVKDCKELIDSLLERREHACLAERLHREGKLPKRICHCDTKVDNILFDKEGNVACVIDLDTVMPSFVFSDFGDFLRSAANTGKEDDPDLENVRFDMEIFRAFTNGYLESASAFLTDEERENLPYAAERFPYMQAVRFLTDYLNGDVYYKTLYAEHNLVRARAQFRLLEDVEAHLEEMTEYIRMLTER